MARMWPSRLPDHVLKDPRRWAERKVYARLADVLDDSWSVYYSRPWLGVNARGGEVDGEADFIVVHPVWGLLFLEVKGGAIAYDAALSRWTSTDRYGAIQKIKDPVGQAIACKHRYLKRLRIVDDWPAGYIRFRHGVVLPDTLPPTDRLLTIGGYELALFCFAPAFDGSFRQWIEGRLGDHGAAQPEIGPGNAGAECVRALVAEPVTLRVAMRSLIEGELQEMDALLTGAQLNVLVELGTLPKAVIEGGAGTGKTVVACELAAREAAFGRSVLMLCASEPLARFLSGRMVDWEGVDCLTLGEFRSRRSGPTRAPSAREVWDVVIVDEGQDVPVELWSGIEGAVASNGRGPYVFMDSNQAVYVLSDDIGTRLGADKLMLRLNLRNTKRIAAVSEGLYRGPLVVAEGPDGIDVSATSCSNSESHDLASQLIRRLVIEEAVPPFMVAALSDEDSRPMLEAALGRRGVRTRPSLQPGDAAIVESVRRFKGLEAPIVVVVASRSMAQDPELSYVAVSRARSRLFVFGPIEGTLLGDAIAKGQ
jgi:hypothetical protein